MDNNEMRCSKFIASVCNMYTMVYFSKKSNYDGSHVSYHVSVFDYGSETIVEYNEKTPMLAFERYIELCKKFGMDSCSENYFDMKSFLEEIK